MSYPNVIQEVNTIKSTYTPRSGTTMSGTLTFSIDNVLKQHDNISTLTIFGGMSANEGGNISLYGMSHSSNPGGFTIRANDGTTSKQLIAKPDGTFTWGGNNVITSAGGTISGKLYFTGSHIINNKTGGEIRIVCDDAGTVTSRPALILFEKGNSSYPGFFYLRSANGTEMSDLIGKPDGTLTWGSKHVVRIDAQSTGATGYRKYADGFRIQWGRINVNECVKTTVTLPIAFSNANYHVDVCNASGKTVADTEGVMTVCEYTTTNFKISTGYITPNTSAAVWFACGY